MHHIGGACRVNKQREEGMSHTICMRYALLWRCGLGKHVHSGHAMNHMGVEMGV